MPVLEFWESKNYERVSINGVRHYDIDGRHYPSVTSVTSLYGKHKLDSWRARVGEETAQKICDKAATNGTHIHELAEKYILTNSVDYRNSSVLQRIIFGNFKKMIDGITTVHLLENTLYSHKLKLAGTVDCVGVYNNTLSIIDFKTSKSVKPIEWVENYLVQTTIYAMMIYEMFEIPIHQVVLLFACQNLEESIITKKIDKDLLNLTKKYINHYRNNVK